MEQKYKPIYKICKNEYMPKPYYVAKRVETFWIRVSKYYTHKGFAKRTLNKLKAIE